MNACWAPITSVLSRLTSAPVWVRVKNATGIRWTWREDPGAQVVDQALADLGGQPRCHSVSTASTTARPATPSATATTTDLLLAPSGDTVVDDHLEQQRQGHHEQRVEHHQHEEDR